MSRLAPDLFNRRYDDLVRIGLSRLPGVAPEWTDYNAHDPGVTLMEMLAAVAEAQLYSLARMRRDERAAYAALMGVEPVGARPAEGLIWPDPDDPQAPGALYPQAMVIEPDATARIAGSEAPLFRPAARLLWIPARITLLKTRLTDSALVDHLGASRRGGPAFAPLGEGDGRGVTLRLGLAATGWAPLIPADRPADALLAIGFRADPARTPGTGAIPAARGAIEARLITEDGVFELPIRDDGTDGMRRSGALLLDLSHVEGAPGEAIVEFRAPNGVDRPPRLLRVDVNVVPVTQRQAVEESHHDATGGPDQQFDLEKEGLAYAAGDAPLIVEVTGPGGGASQPWRLVDRLADCGPGDKVFGFDPFAGRVRFGNGLNGAIPPLGSTITARYRICDGALGNLAANRKWTLQGFAGTFGVNPDRVTGGEDAADSITQRGAARRSLRDDHPLVSAKDFEDAALNLAELEVGRAWMIPFAVGVHTPGVDRLLVMRARGKGPEPASAPETPRWLEAVRRALAPRTLLGGRLEVVAPRYVGFSVQARIECVDGADPTRVRQKILDTLATRLTLVSTSPAVRARGFGEPVSRRDLAAWIKALPETRRILDLAIVADAGARPDILAMPATGLPRCNWATSEISVARRGQGGAS